MKSIPINQLNKDDIQSIAHKAKKKKDASTKQMKNRKKKKKAPVSDKINQLKQIMKSEVYTFLSQCDGENMEFMSDNAIDGMTCNFIVNKEFVDILIHKPEGEIHYAYTFDTELLVKNGQVESLDNLPKFVQILSKIFNDIASNKMVYRVLDSL